MAISPLVPEPSMVNNQVRTPSRRRISPGYKFAVGIALAAVDFVIVMGIALALFCIRFWSVRSSFWWQEPYLPFHLELFLTLAFLIVIASSHYGLYAQVQRQPAFDEALAVIRANGLAALLLIVSLYIGHVRYVSRLLVLITTALALGLQIGVRLLRRRLMRARIIGGYGGQNVLIIGASESGYALAKYLEANPQFGYRVSGFLDDKMGEPQVLGNKVDLAKIASEYSIDQIIIPPPSQPRVPLEIVSMAEELGIGIKVVTEFYDNVATLGHRDQLGDFSVISLDEDFR